MQEDEDDVARHAEARFQALLAHSADAITVTTPDGALLYTSPGTERILGFPPTYFANRSVADLLHPDDRLQILGSIRAILETPGDSTIVVGRVAHADGSWRFLEGRVTNMLDDPSIGGLVCNFRDITSRKQTEAMLAKREAQLQSAARIAHLGVWERDLTSGLLTWSDEMYAIWGMTRGEPLMHAAVVELVHPDDRDWLAGLIAESERTLRPYTAVYRIIRPDGAERILQSNGAVFVGDDGRPTRLFGIAQDITVQMQIEAERSQLFAEVLTSRTQLQHLSHQVLQAHEDERRAIARELHDEIGQSLTGLSLLLAACVPDASATNSARLSQAQQQLTELIAQVRTIALDLRPAVLDDFGLVAGLLHLIDRYEAQTHITITITVAFAAKRRFASDVEIAVYRVVQEALTNVARHAQVTAAQVHLRATSDELQATITDMGCGFDLAIEQARTSSGLAGMRERTMLLGGELLIESYPGAGTRVIASFPLVATTS
jgi:PAS domain S-box-containing protein